MAFRGPLPLTETSPGVYETWWTIPEDIDLGIRRAMGVLVQEGVRRATTPAVGFMPLAAPAAAAPPPSGPLPPPAAPPLAVSIVPTPGAAPIPVVLMAPSGEPVALPTITPIPLPPPSAGGPYPGTALGGPVGVGAAIRTTPDDILILGVRNAKAGVTVAMTARLWTDAATWAGSILTITPPSDRSLNFYALPLSWGYLAAVSAMATTGAPVRGQVFATIRLARGLVSAFTTYALLAQDYLTSEQGPSGSPRGRVVSSLEGPGTLIKVVGSPPGAGQDWEVVVPTAARWRLMAVEASLTTSIAAGNRTPSLGFWTRQGVIIQMLGSQVLGPSATLDFQWLRGQPALVNAAGVVNQWLLPDLVLESGWGVLSKTAGLLGGDIWGLQNLFVEEVIED